MKNKLILILFIVTCCFSVSGQTAKAANWYSFPDMYLQYRTDQFGVQYNRFHFELPDASGNTSLTDPTQLVSFTLTDPNGNPVPITINDMNFGTYMELAGRYNAGSGTWEWYDPTVTANDGWTTHGANAPFMTHGDFWCILPSTIVLTAGTYTLDVTMLDGSTFQKTYTLNPPVALPTVSSKTLKAAWHSDPLDVVATWSAPSVDLVRASPDRGLGTRAVVRLMSKTKVNKKTVYTEIGQIVISVPFNMGMAYLPSFVIDTIDSTFSGQVDHAEICVFTRTNNNNNRVYSKWVKMKKPPKH